jgi:hypothetical protein
MQDREFEAISDIFRRLAIRISVNTGYGLKNPTTTQELVALRAKLQKGYPEIFSKEIAEKTEQYLAEIGKIEAEKAKEEQKRRQIERKEWNSAYQRFLRALRNRRAYPTQLLQWSAETPLSEQREAFIRFVSDFKRRALPLPQEDIDFGLSYIYSIVASGNTEDDSLKRKIIRELRDIKEFITKHNPIRTRAPESYVS